MNLPEICMLTQGTLTNTFKSVEGPMEKQEMEMEWKLETKTERENGNRNGNATS